MKSPPAVTTPRNMKQLRNLRYKHLNQRRISRDALYNKHELAYDIPGFIRKITTYPDLVCISGLQEILEQANKVLQLKSPSQLLSYDTTFKLGDFYVSPLLFKKVTCGFTMNFDIETGEFIHYIAHWSGALDDCDNNWHKARNSTWNYLYDQPIMRKHLYKSFQTKTMTLFPLKKERRNKELKVKTEEEILVYCHCRMPDEGWDPKKLVIQVLITLFCMNKTTGDVWNPERLVIPIQKALFCIQYPQMRAGTNRD